MVAPKQRTPIDKQRDAAFSFEVSADDDDSHITDMLPLGGRLYTIKERGIYVVQTPDDIDPERTNANIPHTVQRVVSRGSSSEIVGKTLLTAKRLLDDGRLPKSIDTNQALLLSLEVLKHVVAIDDLAADFDRVEVPILESNVVKKSGQNGVRLAAVGDVRNRVKTCNRDADAAVQCLFRIVQHFYPKLSSGGWKTLLEEIERRHGKEDPFAKVLVEVAPILRRVRELRNCFEHERDDQKIVVHDFTLGSDGVVRRPSMEVRYHGTTYAPLVVAEYLRTTAQMLPSVFEVVLAGLCSKCVLPFGVHEVAVDLLPEDRWRSHVRYGYWIMLGGSWAPLG